MSTDLRGLGLSFVENHYTAVIKVKPVFFETMTKILGESFTNDLGQCILRPSDECRGIIE